MTTIPDHYAALGIDPTADPEVITAAYRALAKKFHPDTGAAAGTASPERFDEIQRAYEVLRNPDTRHAYDLELLEATERELQEHIAAKRRVVVREPERASAAPPPDLDLGDIRPEPAVPPRAAAAARARKPRPLMPFLVPLVLVAMLGGGAAALFLPAGPEALPEPAPAVARSGDDQCHGAVGRADPVHQPSLSRIWRATIRSRCAPPAFLNSVISSGLRRAMSSGWVWSATIASRAITPSAIGWQRSPTWSSAVSRLSQNSVARRTASSSVSRMSGR